MKILYWLIQGKWPFTPFDTEKVGQHGQFSQSTKLGPVGTHMHHINVLSPIGTERTIRRPISGVKILTCWIKVKFRSHDLIIVGGQRRSLIVYISIIMFKFIKYKMTEWMKILFWIILGKWPFTPFDLEKIRLTSPIFTQHQMLPSRYPYASFHVSISSRYKNVLIF